jgi:hypothetical protein
MLALASFTFELRLALTVVGFISVEIHVFRKYTGTVLPAG